MTSDENVFLERDYTRYARLLVKPEFPILPVALVSGQLRLQREMAGLLITSRSDLQGRVELKGGNESLHCSVLTGFSSLVLVGTLLVALVPLGTATTMRAVILA